MTDILDGVEMPTCTISPQPATILLKLSADAPRWHADTGIEMAQRFAREYPSRKGVRDGVFFHVQRGSEFVGVYVWRTPTGTIKADIAVAKPLTVIAADP